MHFGLALALLAWVLGASGSARHHQPDEDPSQLHHSTSAAPSSSQVSSHQLHQMQNQLSSHSPQQNQPPHRHIIQTPGEQPLSADAGRPEAGLQASDLYHQAQANRFRVNVTNLCERDHMRVTVRLNKPFYGLIHAKDARRKRACSAEGTGAQVYSLQLAFTQQVLDEAHCGAVSHSLVEPPGAKALSLALVVRLHKNIDFSDDRYFLLTCANRCTRPDCSLAPSAEASSRHIQLTAASETLENSRLLPDAVGRAEHILEPKCAERRHAWPLKLAASLSLVALALAGLTLCLCTTLIRLRKRHQPRTIGHKMTATDSGVAPALSHLVGWSPYSTEQIMQAEQQQQAADFHRLLEAAQAAPPMPPARNRPETGSETRNSRTVGRRRSIGTTAKNQVPNHKGALVESNQQRSARGTPSKLGPAIRAKSKSQTTILYEQGREPFTGLPLGGCQPTSLADSIDDDNDEDVDSHLGVIEPAKHQWSRVDLNNNVSYVYAAQRRKAIEEWPTEGAIANSSGRPQPGRAQSRLESGSELTSTKGFGMVSAIGGYLRPDNRLAR